MRPKIYCFTHRLARILIPRYGVREDVEVASPAVYLVHHQNLRGPLYSMTWFNKTMRPWALSVFCDRAACFHQYYDYTFTKRLGIPRWLAAVLAFILSFWVSGLMPKIRAIPVYRGTQEIIRTFRQSMVALKSGDNLLICPDIDYASNSPDIGDMYKGFLLLDRFYVRATGKHLAFVPLHIDENPRCIHAGRPVSFTGSAQSKEELARVYESIMNEFHRLQSAGAAN